MRYQLPDGMTSISAAGHSFEADIDGIIEVASDVGAEVHQGLQDMRLWGLTPLEEIAGAEVTGSLATQIAAVLGAPTAAPGPMREHKKNLLALLRGFGHVLDGRVTFEFLRRKTLTILGEMDPESLAAAKESAKPTPTIAEIEAAIRAGSSVDIAPDGSVTITKQTPDGQAADQAEDGVTPPPSDPPATPPGPTNDAGAAEPADPLTAPIVPPPSDPAATPPSDPPTPPPVDTPATPGA
jgi:hypothetical protein